MKKIICYHSNRMLTPQGQMLNLLNVNISMIQLCFDISLNLLYDKLWQSYISYR